MWQAKFFEPFIANFKEMIQFLEVRLSKAVDRNINQVASFFFAKELLTVIQKRLVDFYLRGWFYPLLHKLFLPTFAHISHKQGKHPHRCCKSLASRRILSLRRRSANLFTETLRG